MPGQFKVVLFLLAAIFAAPAVQAAKQDSPAQIPGATTVDVTQAKQLFMQGVKFVDVRSDSDWRAGRIPLAYHLELKHVFSRETLAEIVAQDEPVVFYCNSLKCHRSAKATQKAVSWGYRHVYYFRLGYPNWKKAMNPIE
ncbi:rhodanese-like domain-containing protein [Alcanivorax sp.]|uniref:rhodanese-like domain-containing protein n=1 Tax=Alcanivorax sp. TaxID=1872427 RepID=UPI00258D23DF|nr:rhodanese-like domain-containing protein [Alcanivorax sp.]